MQQKNILIVDDDKDTLSILTHILSSQNYSISTALNGKEGLARCEEIKFDAIVTDWMMPEIDGLEFIKKIRNNFSRHTMVIMITSLTSPDARRIALDSGADDFLIKPFKPQEIIDRIENLFQRQSQPMPQISHQAEKKKKIHVPFSAVCLAASTGGPSTLKKVLQSLKHTTKAAFMIVLHSPSWSLEDIAKRWQYQFLMELILAKDGMEIETGKIYLAPGDFHMTASPIRIKLLDSEPENYVKPSADPLFRSVAKTFGSKSIAVILTGMGCDGALGAINISSAGGIVIAQEPGTAIVSSMPNNVIKTVNKTEISTISNMPESIQRHIDQQNR